MYSTTGTCPGTPQCRTPGRDKGLTPVNHPAALGLDKLGLTRAVDSRLPTSNDTKTARTIVNLPPYSLTVMFSIPLGKQNAALNYTTLPRPR